ncbi:uncharacterized protein LOC123200960 isoform X2 [Mangifera indica]|uniref:uncharacterized protein LOC123200960 isoform X2 n=1 Tax=Mangifera indica TaxID=29780 RepID=UPI001CFA0759|nr:uncharacterized protein LOC123200960 isoform X2 [Mangifera indica]
MVQLTKSGNSKSEPETTSCRDKVPVKLEIVEDSLEEEYGPLNKRSKPSLTIQRQQWSAWNNDSDNDGCPILPSQYNPLNEPSPLGLRLRKSPSLLDLIQMRLSQAPEHNLNPVVKKESKAASAASSSATDKLKASNFPASLLRIGQWEYKSRYEGDLVAKCYFAKHKLVWEVLEGGLKSKIEIQWSDIMALKANCPDKGPGTLNVVLARPPLFFRETNPQPRKHTLWQATADFTDGQASILREHFLRCPQGLLNKHFEKLIQCDMRLNFLSRQPEISLDSPYFEPKGSICDDPVELKSNQVEISQGSSITGVQNLASPVAAHSSSFEIERGEPSGIGSENMSQEAPSPSSGSGTCEVNSKGTRNWDQIKVPGLRPSMSMSDFMNHIESCLSDQMSIVRQPEEGADCHELLEDIAQYLLSDTQLTTVSDEKSLMSRVNSLCCLLQKEPGVAQNCQANGESSDARPNDDDGKNVQLHTSSEPLHDNKNVVEIKASEVDPKDFSGSKPTTGMSRKDSFSELLLHLPRIASLPKFLFNISEEGSEAQSR